MLSLLTAPFVIFLVVSIIIMAIIAEVTDR